VCGAGSRNDGSAKTTFGLSADEGAAIHVVASDGPALLEDGEDDELMDAASVTVPVKLLLCDTRRCVFCGQAGDLESGMPRSSLRQAARSWVSAGGHTPLPRHLLRRGLEGRLLPIPTLLFAAAAGLHPLAPPGAIAPGSTAAGSSSAQQSASDALPVEAGNSDTLTTGLSMAQ
jgi:hypothetical protein